jgi:hypothetical protein
MISLPPVIESFSYMSGSAVSEQKTNGRATLRLIFQLFRYTDVSTIYR